MRYDQRNDPRFLQKLNCLNRRMFLLLSHDVRKSAYVVDTLIMWSRERAAGPICLSNIAVGCLFRSGRLSADMMMMM